MAPPRPTADLFPTSLRLSPKQRLVLRTLHEYPGGSKATDIAQALGMHVNTVRGHLDELIERGAVDVVTAPISGRGRPSLLFRACVPDGRIVTNEYVDLVNLLTEVAGLTPQQARDLGRRWAQNVAPEDSSERLWDLLRRMGFDPSSPLATDDGDAVTLRACPFVTPGGAAPSPVICSVHAGFIEAIAGSERSVTLQTYLDGPECRVVLGPGS
ncbi:helix-turn-helix transcriptional regulator [Corynebacterium uterequi]|uniref:Putative transcriptional regulator n=1 Tax=Corynebacterium uterequi TaxID=1072256 RepID=A0A0G3HFZ0_9CORY|nr:helix-turn-helix domain-containing protein [Corynebacterium uterequi]AKK10873.1 putative transcriptional regulator [Corynebacterium uterequi]